MLAVALVLRQFKCWQHAHAGKLSELEFVGSSGKHQSNWHVDVVFLHQRVVL
jgi:hypothetical protein